MGNTQSIPFVGIRCHRDKAAKDASISPYGEDLGKRISTRISDSV